MTQKCQYTHSKQCAEQLNFTYMYYILGSSIKFNKRGQNNSDIKTNDILQIYLKYLKTRIKKIKQSNCENFSPILIDF